MTPYSYNRKWRLEMETDEFFCQFLISIQGKHAWIQTCCLVEKQWFWCVVTNTWHSWNLSLLDRKLSELIVGVSTKWPFLQILFTTSAVRLCEMKPHFRLPLVASFQLCRCHSFDVIVFATHNCQKNTPPPIKGTDRSSCERNSEAYDWDLDYSHSHWRLLHIDVQMMP